MPGFAGRAAIGAALLSAALLLSAVIGDAWAEAWAELRGHGGPVRTLAVTPDGRIAISGSFDQSAILWDIDEGTALAVLRWHDGAVNAVAALPDRRVATAGEDGRIAIFGIGNPDPVQVFTGHRGPIVGLAIAAGGEAIASASWDGAVRVHPLAGGAARVLEGHQGNVNAVALLPDGRIASAGYDATVRIWPRDAGAPVVITLPAPVNAVVASPDGEIAAAGADGTIRLIKSDGTLIATVEAAATPITGLAVMPDGSLIAAATINGEVALIDRWQARVVRRIAGIGAPVWSVAFRPGAFRPGGDELLTGGNDGLIRRWDAGTGEPIGPGTAVEAGDKYANAPGDRGAALFRACAACHLLGPARQTGQQPGQQRGEYGNRAGPSLYRVFGRRIATAPGYNFSEALKRLDIVWNAETIARLFEIGPSRYTPGTKMPEQIIAESDDREALVRFLERATADR